MIIAIDGPAASGKGTLARRLAVHYGLAYLDTGLIYRAVGAMGRGIVAVAMGSPLQEKIIKGLREVNPDAFYMGVGGSFDCYCGVVKRAPPAWQNLNLEWLYRLLRQPKRIRRQLIYIPYVALVLANRI